MFTPIKKLVPFTNALGITTMMYVPEVAPPRAASIEVPIDDAPAAYVALLVVAVLVLGYAAALFSFT